jgi:hypothetical protein
MADMTTRPGDKRTQQDGEHATPKPSWGKWKALAGALALAAGFSGPVSCGSSDPDTVINIPVQDGGTVDVNDGGQDHDAGTDAGSGGDAGMGGMDAGSGGMDAGVGGHDGGTGGMDAGSGGDAGMGGMDAGSGGMDAGTGGMDAGSGGDAGMGGMDAGTGGMDAGSGGDAGMGGMDAGVGGSDGGPVACVSASTGQFVGTIGSSPRTVGGYVFSYEGESGTDAVFSITCGGEAVQTDYHCPVGVTTEIDVPVDGKKISITPWSASATTTSCQVKVENL